MIKGILEEMSPSRRVSSSWREECKVVDGGQSSSSRDMTENEIDRGIVEK